MSYVEIKNLTKKFGVLCAVDNLSLSIEQGEIFGLLGPNGAGKSTTLSALTTLIDFDKGDIIVDGLNIRKNKRQVKQLIGMVPQDIAVYTHLNAVENVKFFASLYGCTGSELTRQAEEALEFVGLADRQKMKPKQMSGGMRRRLNIACGIAHAPKLIVMDEPTVGVDAQSREHILNSIKLLKERGTTVIYTSHYMQEVEEICDTIAIIDHGQMVACGTKVELVSLVTEVQSLFVETSLATNLNSEKLYKSLKMIPNVIAVVVEDNVIRIDVKIEQSNLSNIIEHLVALGIPIVKINSEVPNLDTLFLTLTGHELR